METCLGDGYGHQMITIEDALNTGALPAHFQAQWLRTLQTPLGHRRHCWYPGSHGISLRLGRVRSCLGAYLEQLNSERTRIRAWL